MLHRLSANKEEFQSIQFSSGLNLIVADRAPGASEKHSRNARGKTSILQAIDYCLGSKRPTSFKFLAETGWSFTLELDLFNSRVWATREVKGGSRISIKASGGNANLMLSEFLREDGTISLVDWKYLLGLGLFGLDENTEPGSHGISPRTLLSYVIRLDAPRDPTKILAQQPAWSSRQHVAYLLGLDWTYTHALARMERDEEAFKALNYAQEVQLIPGFMEDESELLIKRAELERELATATEQAESFIVLDDPQGTLAESNKIATQITTIMDEQVAAERLLMLYRDSLDEPDDDTDASVVGDLYRELGLVFSPNALRRFDQVDAFHRTLAGNRRRFIESEISRLERDVHNRQPRIDELQTQRQVLLRRLSSGGGLDDLLELQRKVTETKARLSTIDEAIELVRNVQASKDALNVRQATFRRDARENLNRDRSFLDSVNSRFSETIGNLYGRPASITVDVDDLGYKFSIKVSGSSSSGITKMQLFAFDLTLMEQSRWNRHPHFLIHDSTVFDGVDPRQIAGALNLARTTVERAGAQYIVTMNTNDIPPAISSAEWYESCVRRTILDTEVGGAFGVDFGSYSRPMSLAHSGAQ